MPIISGGGVTGGASSPVTVTLGPYTIDHTDGHSVTTDLGADIVVALAKGAYTVTALNFDGDESQGLSIDMENSLDGSEWSIQGAAGMPPNPLAFTTSTVPTTLYALGFVTRYVRAIWSWNGAGGAGSSATFHITLTYLT